MLMKKVTDAAHRYFKRRTERHNRRVLSRLEPRVLKDVGLDRYIPDAPRGPTVY